MAHRIPAGTTRRGLVAAALAAVVLAGCGSTPAPTQEPAAPSAAPAVTQVPPSPAPVASEVPPPRLDATPAGSPAASAGVARGASGTMDGAAACLRNGFGETLQIRIVGADNDSPAFANTDGTEAMRFGDWRCLKGRTDTTPTAKAPTATVTGPNGTVDVKIWAEPGGGCEARISVDGESRCLAVGENRTSAVGGFRVYVERKRDQWPWSMVEVRLDPLR